MPEWARGAVIAGIGLWAGVTLVLAEIRWFARPGLAERLRPYVPPSAAAQPPRTPALSVASLSEVIEPLSRALGERVARLVGISEDLALRLERIHSPYDVTAFRMRQLGMATAALGLSALGAVALRPQPVIALLMLGGAPLLAFLVLEQRLLVQCAAWQRRIFLELPVVAEQLATLLSGGYSLGSALGRLAARGQGACARDLREVTGRIRQGLTEIEALREWAARARVDALDRLVPVLALNRETTDLGRLISEEARTIRRDVQRELVETMERRGQQVWIPVTVATLIPGVIFLAIPFIEALRLFGSQ